MKHIRPDRQRDLIKSAIILLLGTLLAFAFRAFHIREENILMVYLIAVIIIALEVKGYLWGSVCAVLCVVLFNFFFTEPYYTLHVNDPNYLFTMLLFLIVALITSMLVSRLQEQMEITQRNARHTESLFEISSGYLTIAGLDNVLYYGLKSLHRIQHRRCVVYLAEEDGTLAQPFFVPAHFPDPTVLGDGTLAKWCYANVTACGNGTSYYGADCWRYLPIQQGPMALGVLGVYCGERPFQDDQAVFVDMILSQMATAIARERLYLTQNARPAKAEQEHEKSRLLDLLFARMPGPLTRLVSGTEGAAYRDALSADLLLGNLMVLADAHNLPLHKQLCSINDLLAQAYDRFQPLTDGRSLHADWPETGQTLPLDQAAISLVLMNLLDNACRHTRADSHILFDAHWVERGVWVRVSDDGGGMTASALSHLSDPQAQTGLGLPVCRAILEAHHGQLLVENNGAGGLAVSFFLPKQRQH